MSAQILPFPTRPRIVPPVLPDPGTWGEIRDEYGEGGFGVVHAVDSVTGMITLRQPDGSLVSGLANDFTPDTDERAT